jgi:hypothetical protein
VLAWVLPLLTHLAGLDAVLPVLILLGLMSLQRGSRTGLDAFVVATVQLFGALCVAGLLISLWPWRLNPVPIAGFALTGLVLLAVATGRRPALPGLSRTTDLLTLAAGLAVALLALVPFAVKDLGGRIGLVAPGEDFARHFLFFDMIGKVGGYAFLHRPEAAPLVPPYLAAGIETYPQGTYLLYATLDRFWRSSTVSGAAIPAMSWMIWCYVATFGFLAVAALWAVRRVAGPGPSVLVLLPVLAVAAGYLIFGDPSAIFARGYPNEILCLALIAVLTALVARPLTSTGEQVVTLAALVVGVSFTYHMFLPYAGLAALAWAWRYRSRIRLSILAPTVLVGLPAALITPVLVERATGGQQLLLKGTALPTNRVVLVLLVVAAALGTRRRRPLVTAQLGIVVASVLALLVYQYVSVGRTVYYFEKSLHLLAIVALVCAGTLAGKIPPGRPARRLAPALAAGLALAIFAGPGGKLPNSVGLRLLLGVERGSVQGGHDALLIARRYPDGGGKINVDLMHGPYPSFFGTLFASVLQRDYRDGHAWYGFLNPSGPPKTMADLEQMITASARPVRLFVDSEPNLARARQLAEKYPDRIEIVYVPAGSVR